MTTTITLWFRQDTDKPMKYNHLEIGYQPLRFSPNPVNRTQRASWRGCNWFKEKALMINGVVTRDPFSRIDLVMK